MQKLENRVFFPSIRNHTKTRLEMLPKIRQNLLFSYGNIWPCGARAESCGARADPVRPGRPDEKTSTDLK